MKTIMIHEVDEYTRYYLKGNEVLTFDDGLLSQYVYRDSFSDFKSIFYICPSFIENGKNDINQKCMTIDQINDLMTYDNFYIGCHSYSHTPLENFGSLQEKVDYIKKDTEQMTNWFFSNFNTIPTRFCYPYNEDLDGIYEAVLRTYGFTKFHGRERTPIETLQLGGNQ